MTIMQNQHSEMVSVLAKPGKDILAELTPTGVHLLHMAVGVSGEVGEVWEAYLQSEGELLVALIEEFGDIEFYLTGYCQGINYLANVTYEVLDVDLTLHPDQLFQQLVLQSSKLLDLTKKATVYVQPLSIADVQSCLDDIQYWLAVSYRYFSINRDQVLQANYNKLSERYSGLKYSNAAATVRADKQKEVGNQEDSAASQPTDTCN